MEVTEAVIAVIVDGLFPERYRGSIAFVTSIGFRGLRFRKGRETPTASFIVSLNFLGTVVATVCDKGGAIGIPGVGAVMDARFSFYFFVVATPPSCSWHPSKVIG